MNIIRISWRSVVYNPLNAFLNILLVAFGVGLVCFCLLVTDQIGQKLENNARDIDLVVGANGSPLQLILSSIFYVDFPTGNIPMKDADELARNPLVKLAVPLALGDNYNGFRIVGTDSRYIKLYKLTLQSGKFWHEDFEVTIGNEVAEQQHLKVGDRFYGAHGLTGTADIHTNHAYTVSGVLTAQGNVTDGLVLTNIPSIWKMHEEDDEHEGDGRPEPFESNEPEITSLLIQYRSPMSVVLFPRMVDRSTGMQAASPAIESARLFALIGVGVDTVEWLAIFIIAVAAISVFISLYNSLKERKYDLAVMRVMGASKFRLFMIVTTEGVCLALMGTAAGILMGHLGVHLIGFYQQPGQTRLTGYTLVGGEGYLMGTGILIGLTAALLPALRAARTNISTTLAQK